MISKKFIILSTQRSGSTWLVDILNSHHNVKVYSELFTNEEKERPTWAGAKDFLTWNSYWQLSEAKDQFKFYRYRDYLNALYDSGDAGLKAVGFKLMYIHQLRHPLLFPWLYANKVSIVHLIRKNFLDVILSQEGAKKRGFHHSNSETQNIKIHIDTSTLVKRIKVLERKIALARLIFSHLNLPYVEVYYEDMQAGRTKFESILDFLEVPQNGKELRTSLKKLNKGTHQELIENYGAVVEVLKRTKYYDLLRVESSVTD